MSFGVNETLRNAQLNVLRDAIDAGGAAGKLLIYDNTGARPNTGEAPGTCVLLATLTMSYPCAPDAADGELNFAAISDETDAPAGGTALWGRFTSSTDTFVADADVGVLTSDAVIRMNSVTVSEGGIVRVNTGKLTSVNP